MTEKVKVTREQAELINNLLLIVSKQQVLTNFINGDFNHDEGSLKELSVDDIARILYEPNSYEVEPEFKVGDWVVYEDKTLKLKHIGKYAESVEDDCSMVGIEEFRVYQKIPNKFLRHATPQEIEKEKERRWWKKHEREPWELKTGDVLVDADGEIVEVTGKRDDSKDFYINFCSCSLAMIKSRFIVLTFTENRLDVKTND